jgi:hypothetical protein
MVPASAQLLIRVCAVSTHDREQKGKWACAKKLNHEELSYSITTHSDAVTNPTLPELY